MKFAIFALTKKGSELGRRLKDLLHDGELYLPVKFAREGERGYEGLRKTLADVFGRYEAFVFIMAAGVAVRILAPHLKGKDKDPGVVVVDEKGRFVVSLLGGHSRGANELARRIAFLLDARPVVTTSSDINEIPPIDLLGKKFGWELENPESSASVISAILNGGEVGIYQDAGEESWRESLPSNVRIFRSLEELKEAKLKAAILITEKVAEGLPQTALIFRPKNLVVGIGLHRGIEASRVEEAVLKVLREHGLSFRSVRNLATVKGREEEPGLLEFAQKYNLPIDSFSLEELKGQNPPSPSAALRSLGVPGVCEPAALLSSRGKLLIPKVKFKDITLAVAQIEAGPRGKLYFIGLGPGDSDHLTFKARKALEISDVVIGYKKYLSQIAKLIPQKEILPSGMGSELERAKLAFEFASSGRKVALVSGGDPGIYGMAGAFFEFLEMEKRVPNFEIEVVPGVPGLCAASSLLGSPLSCDFACISLSDLLVPWEVIAERLKKAAEGDFVIVLYNPASKGRREGLSRAREIILQYRSPSTPVGFVRNAFREGQEVKLTDLEHLPELKADMSTIILVGNSSSFRLDKWMITPRGYERGKDEEKENRDRP